MCALWGGNLRLTLTTLLGHCRGSDVCAVCVPQVSGGHTVHSLAECFCVSASGAGDRLGLIYLSHCSSDPSLCSVHTLLLVCPACMTATLPATVCTVAWQPGPSGSVFAICATACWMTYCSSRFLRCSGVIQKVPCAAVDVFTLKVRIRCRSVTLSQVEHPPSIPEAPGTIPSLTRRQE